MKPLSSNLWLPIYAARSGLKLRLFCFPYAGSSSLIFRQWSRQMPSDIEVCPIELPGRGRRFNEAPITNLADLLQVLGPALQPALDCPFALFGHSMGALISFELTRWLRSHNLPQPTHLFLSGRQAPQIPEPPPVMYRSSDAELIDHLRRYNGTPAPVLDNAELMALLLPTIRADFQLLETYTYVEQPPLTCSITIMGGIDDAIVAREDLLGWRSQTTADYKIRLFPGDHFFLHTAEQQLIEYCICELL